MPEPFSHEEIATRFLESGSVNFEAVGAFVSKLGPELVTRDEGLHGVLYGRFNTLACILRADDLGQFFGGLRGAGGLSQAVDLPEG